jgi:hypothetical protein
MNRTEAQLFRIVFAVFTAIVGVSSSASAQVPETVGTLRHEVFVASPAESYLRYLQSVGKVPLHPWSSRGFSERELKKLVPTDSAHPWRDRFVDSSREYSGIRYEFLAPDLSMRYNTGFAYGSNDGPVWAGRGLTSAVQRPASMRRGNSYHSQLRRLHFAPRTRNSTWRRLAVRPV